MTTPAVRDNQSTLEAVLLDVLATLQDLLVAADEQYAALVARDLERLESVTRQQERLSARLARAESQRIEILGSVALHDAGPEPLRQSIANAVRQLKQRQAQTASLLQRSVDLTGETLDFLVRLVSAPAPSYGNQGIARARRSVLLDGRA
jgi:flagellar biosynthesis/type III secretory pathway chaperone